MTVALAALLSHWRRHPMQFLMLVMGLSLATALWSGVQAINAEARASYDRAASALGQNRLERIEAADGGPVSQSDYIALRRQGWPVSPMIEGRLDRKGLRLLGIDPVTLPSGGAPQVAGEGHEFLDFISDQGLMLVSPETMTRLDTSGLPPLRETADVPPGTAIVDIGTAQRLLGMKASLTRLVLPADFVPFGPLPANLVLRTPGAEGDLARLTDSFHLNLTAFGFLAFAVGLFIVHSAIGLAFEQRRPMFRTLRALGVSARALVGLFLAELLVLATVSGLIGIAIGYVVAAALLPDVAATLRGLYGADVTGALSLRPTWWAAGLGIAVAGTLVAAAQNLWQLWRLPLLAPAQPRAWARASRTTLLRQAGSGGVLLMLSLAFLRPGSELWAGFAGLAALLLGAALLLPGLLVLATSAGAKLARSVMAEWLWADARQQVPGLSLALMALLLALAANIGVGTMVSSFRLTFTGWLDQRLASELYVTARSADEAARMADWLRTRSDAVLPIWSAETVLLDRPTGVYGVADHATYRDNWPMLEAVPDAWDRVAAGQAALVNEQLFISNHMGLGDVLHLPGGPLPIAGVYSDYGNTRPQVLISLGALDARFPQAEKLRLGIRIAPELAPRLAHDLSVAFDLPPGVIVDQAAIKAASLRVFEQTFAVTAALNVLTLGVAGLAMFASLLTLSAMRLPQVAPVWAMGVARRRLALIDLGRTLMLSALTLVAALPLGLANAWALLAVVNVAAFGWRLPMYLFPGDWLRLGAVAMVAALAASILPALRLARTPPADLLKVFANER